MQPIRLNLLGGIEVDLPFCAWLTPRVAALLGYLALHPHRAQTRDKLAALFWEESSDEKARSSLRQVLSTLRGAAPELRDLIVAEREWISLRRGSFSTDVAEFEAAVESPQVVQWARALDLYRGDLLDGLHVRSNGFEAWLVSERQRLKLRAVGLMIRLLEAAEPDRDVERSIALALRVLSLDPAQELVHRALMRLYQRRGQRSDALRQYSRCRDAVRRELETSPEPETETLYRHILQGAA